MLRIGVGRGILVGMLPEQADEKLLAQFGGTCFALVKGDEAVGELFVEHQVEGGPGLLKELLAEHLMPGSTGVVHDVSSKKGGRSGIPPILSPAAGRSYGDAPGTAA